VCKVEVNTEVKISGAQTEEEGGLVRSACKVDGKAGFMTVRQNKGAAFLKATMPFVTFCSAAEKSVSEATTAVQRASQALNLKLKQGGVAEEGPLKDARAEMTKLREDLVKAQKGAEGLKAAYTAAKSAFQAKERSEINAHIETRNMKECAAFLEGPNEKVAAMEAVAKAMEEAVAPLGSLSGEDLKSFATPASLQETVEKLSVSVTEQVTAAREALTEQTKAINEVKPPTAGTAYGKQKLKELTMKVDQVTRKIPQTLAVVKGKVATIVTPLMQPTAEAIRKHAQAKKLSGDQLFDSLKVGEKVPEAAFCKLVASLEGLNASAEVAKLICARVEADGISKDNFLKFVVQYYKVVRGIAFTDNQDVNDCKTLRKVEEGEVLELLEGPVELADVGMTRVRVKACSGTHDEGWVTVAGSKGTAFLQKCSKPVEKKA